MTADNLKSKVALYQGKIGCGIPYSDLKKIIDYNPDFTVLPEYFWIRPGAVDHLSASKGFHSSLGEIKELSQKIRGYLISGTMVEAENGLFYNTCFIADNGELIGKHRKVYLYGKERGVLTPGDGFHVYNLGGVQAGIIICADALDQSTFIKMKELGAQVIFAPTLSKLIPEDTEDNKLNRDVGIFKKGAELSGAVVVKCCSVGKLFDGMTNGRSLICTPEEFIYRSDEISEKEIKVITAEIQIQPIKELK